MKPKDIVQVTYRPITPTSQHLMEHVSLDQIRGKTFDHDPYSPHQITFFFIFIITSGESTHFIDFKTYDIQRGCCILLRPGQIHHFGDITKIDGAIIAMAPELIKAMTIENPNLSDLIDGLFSSIGPVSLSTSEIKSAEGLLNEIKSLLYEKSFSLDYGTRPMGFLASFILSQFNALEAIGLEKGRIYKNNPLIKNFLENIEKDLKFGKTISDYADEISVSARTLDRHCTEILGKSAKQVLNDRILLEAKRILTYSKNPLKVIAEQLGFSDVSAFSKFFTKEEGIPPGQFRQK